MIAPATSEPARRTIEELDRESKLAAATIANAALYQRELRDRILAEPIAFERAALSSELRKVEAAAKAARDELNAIIREIASRGGRPKGFRDF